MLLRIETPIAGLRGVPYKEIFHINDDELKDAEFLS